MSVEVDPVFCSFTNGFGENHRDVDAKLRCCEASIAENPQNEPDIRQVAETADLLANNTDLDDDAIGREALILNVTHRWKNGRTIKVGFIDGPDWAHTDILETAKRWTKYANLEFVRETNLSAAEIRIGLRSGGGSWSQMGTSALGTRTGQTMHLGWYVASPGAAVVLHEFGHVLAFPHEQFHPQRKCTYNRQAVINDLSGPPNNWSIQQIEFNVLRPPWSGDTYTRYDPESIMHYAQPGNWFTDPACAVAPNRDLSRRDKKGAALWYPRPSMDAVIDSAVKVIGASP